MKALDKGKTFAWSYEWRYQNGCSDAFVANFELILFFSKAFAAEFDREILSEHWK